MDQALAWLWQGLVTITSHLFHATLTTFLELFILFGPLLFATLVSHFISLRVETRIIRLAGPKAYVYLLGWLGTPVHELGHALMARLFGHRIDKLRLFAPDFRSGQLGAVHHSYDGDNLLHVVGNLFIALGPVFLGTGVLALAGLVLLGQGLHFPAAVSVELADFDAIPTTLLLWFADVGNVLVASVRSIPWDRWQTWLFVYLLLSIGSHINLSPADLEGAKGGFSVLVLVLFFANIVMLLFFDVPLRVFWTVGRYMGLLASVVLLCAMAMAPVWLLLEATSAVLDRRAPARRRPPR